MSQSVEEDFVTFDLVTGFKACLAGCSSTKMENGLFSCPPNIFAGLANAFSSWQPFSTPVWKLIKFDKAKRAAWKGYRGSALPGLWNLNSNFAISYLCCPRRLDPNIVRYTPKSRPFWCISCGQTCICLLYTPWSKVFGILLVDIVSKHKRRHCLQKSICSTKRRTMKYIFLKESKYSELHWVSLCFQVGNARNRAETVFFQAQTVFELRIQLSVKWT